MGETVETVETVETFETFETAETLETLESSGWFFDRVFNHVFCGLMGFLVEPWFYYPRGGGFSTPEKFSHPSGNYDDGKNNLGYPSGTHQGYNQGTRHVDDARVF